MKRFLSVFALFLIIVGCSTAPAPSPSTPPASLLDVIETWSGTAKGVGGDCPSSEVNLNILEDFSISGMAVVEDYDLHIRLEGKLTNDGKLRASGSGAGFNVKYKGNFNTDTASGTWTSNWPNCHGWWNLAKN